MTSLRDRFDFKRLINETRPLMARDFILDPGKLPSLESYEVEAESVRLLESPLAVQRHVDLRNKEDPHKTIELDMVLCLSGHSDAVERMFWAIENFQREVSEDLISVHEGLGDFGVAWAWEANEVPNMVAFVINNMVVTLYAHFGDAMVPAGIELSSMLPKETIDAYPDAEPRVFKAVRDTGGGAIEVDAGARLEIGEPPSDGETLFFLATGGAVNRDANAPEVRYYRAGLEKGHYEITVIRVGSGVVPAIERLEIEIV